LITSKGESDMHRNRDKKLGDKKQRNSRIETAMTEEEDLS